jgi:hypothetical protein
LGSRLHLVVDRSIFESLAQLGRSLLLMALRADGGIRSLLLVVVSCCCSLLLL